jgi:hypothetical protein
MFKYFAVCALLLALETGSVNAQQQDPGKIELPGADFDISRLTADSDFAAFMRKDVPEDIRRAVLRRLWVLMQLPVSCDELCQEVEPAAPSPARVASEKLSVAVQ